MLRDWNSELDHARTIHAHLPLESQIFLTQVRQIRDLAHPRVRSERWHKMAGVSDRPNPPAGFEEVLSRLLRIRP